MKKQSGITLIALIITIIVMLILVGVTVNVALNGGLFTTAKTAVKDTQYEADREILQSAVIAALDSNNLTIPDAQTLENNLPEVWTVTGSDGGPYTATSPNGNIFKVLSDGTIIEESTGDLALLEKYFVGKDFLMLNPNIYYGGEFVDDPETIPDASTSIIIIGRHEDHTEAEAFAYIKYNKNVYKIEMEIEETESSYLYLVQSLKLVYEPQGREGEKVSYDSNNDGTDEEWMIIYDNGNNVEMVSMNNMGTLALGYNDEEAQTAGDIDKDGSSNTNIDKAIYSYNNAITRLNNYCANIVTNENKISVRSAGSNPNNPASENSTLYTSDNLANWAEGKYNRLGKSGDVNLEQDLVRMIYYGIANTGEAYWMSSRRVDDDLEHTSFSVCCCYVEPDTCYWYEYLINIMGNNVYSSSYSYGVRPVIKISSDSV